MGAVPVAGQLCLSRVGAVSENPLRKAAGAEGNESVAAASEDEFYQITAEEAAKEFDPLELVYPKEVPVFEKYDEYVPEELVRKGFAWGVLDVEGMKQRVLGWPKTLCQPHAFPKKDGGNIV